VGWLRKGLERGGGDCEAVLAVIIFQNPDFKFFFESILVCFVVAIRLLASCSCWDAGTSLLQVSLSCSGSGLVSYSHECESTPDESYDRGSFLRAWLHLHLPARQISPSVQVLVRSTSSLSAFFLKVSLIRLLASHLKAPLKTPRRSDYLVLNHFPPDETMKALSL